MHDENMNNLTPLFKYNFITNYIINNNFKLTIKYISLKNVCEFQSFMCLFVLCSFVVISACIQAGRTT